MLYIRLIMCLWCDQDMLGVGHGVTRFKQKLVLEVKTMPFFIFPLSRALYFLDQKVFFSWNFLLTVLSFYITVSVLIDRNLSCCLYFLSWLLHFRCLLFVLLRIYRNILSNLQDRLTDFRRLTISYFLLADPNLFGTET